MAKVLDRVNSTEDLKKLTLKEKQELANDIRELIINTVSKTGGHLASNLGVVELTIAIHSVFNAPIDKIVWDVGHQSYVHKILTGRKDKMPTLRQFEGIAGFPRHTESEYDSFDTGHSSTSISAALGMAIARDLKQDKENVIAIIGDRSINGRYGTRSSEPCRSNENQLNSNIKRQRDEHFKKCWRNLNIFE